MVHVGECVVVAVVGVKDAPGPPWGRLVVVVIVHFNVLIACPTPGLTAEGVCVPYWQGTVDWLGSAVVVC